MSARPIISGAAILVLLGTGIALLLERPGAPDDDRPNVILIISDDQRADTMTAMPKLVSFMQQGTTYTNAFVTTPLCCPSRSSILTGLYAHNHGVKGNRKPYGFSAFEDSSTLATWLHHAGYRTGLIGKYLNDYDRDDADYAPPGWDVFEAFIDMPGYTEYSLTHHVDGNYQGITAEAGYSTDKLTDDAKDFIASADDQAFFLMFTPYAPHQPATPPSDYQGTTSFEDLPSYNEADVSDKSTVMASLPLLSEKDARDIVRLKRGTYGALLALDENLKELFDSLESLGELDNTVIIYMGDNGVQWGEHRLPFGKAAPYEESIHVPLLVYDGRNPEGKSDDRFALNIDLAPTIADLVNVTTPALDGRSLFDAGAWRRAFLTEAWGGEDVQPFTSVRSTDAMYVKYADGTEEFYDLANDPHELTNVATAPDLQAAKERFVELLKQLTVCKGEECQVTEDVL